MAEPTNVTEEIQPEPVDEKAIRRKAAWDGMKAGLKRGVLWGGVAGLGGTGLITALTFGAAKGAAGGTLAAFLGVATKWPLIGVAIGGIAAAFGLGTYQNAGGLGGMIWSGLGAFASVAIPAVAIAAVGGALIGATYGAISGYMGADEKIEAAELQAKREAKTKNIERAQAERAQQQLLEAERRFDQQTEQLGNLSPAHTGGQGMPQPPGTRAPGTPV